MTNKATTAAVAADRSVPAGPAGPRRQALHRLIAERGFIAVADVAREIGVSDMTVRRDLEVLERDGLVQRSHGGAVLAPPATVIPAEPSYAARWDLNRAAKQRIAAAAAGLVSPGEAIGLDVGSTVACLAAELAAREGIEIVTNSLQTILAMPQPVLPEVFLLGGRLRPREGSLCGGITRQQLAGHWMDRVFIGVAGIDEHGIYDYSPEEAEVKSVFMQQASTTIVLCDSSKFGRRSFVRVCGFEAIGTIVTDGELPPKIQDAIGKAGTRIIVAKQGLTD
jgi:DeoR/GlpR family transcriptional regulator of sugar metabolism